MSLFSDFRKLVQKTDNLADAVERIVTGDGPGLGLKITIGPKHNPNNPSFIFALKPFRETHMSVTASIGHTISFTYVILDQHGNPMLTQPTFDATPVWSDTTPATETVTADASGVTATGTPLAAGTDTVNVTAQIGGVDFPASIDVSITPEVQVPTSARIDAVVN